MKLVIMYSLITSLGLFGLISSNGLAQFFDKDAALVISLLIPSSILAILIGLAGTVFSLARLVRNKNTVSKDKGI